MTAQGLPSRKHQKPPQASITVKATWSRGRKKPTSAGKARRWAPPNPGIRWPHSPLTLCWLTTSISLWLVQNCTSSPSMPA